MNRFCQETWELWYWAMFCPSRLQQRMNEWSDKTVGSTNFSDILLVSVHWQFVAQFCSIVGCSSLPLCLLLLQRGTPIEWLLLPITWLMAYGIAVWFLPVSLHIPLIVGLVYSLETVGFRKNLQLGMTEVAKILPSPEQFLGGVSAGVLSLGLVSAGVYGLLKQQQITLAQVLFVVGSALATGLGTWLSSLSLLLTVVMTAVAVLFSYLLRNEINYGDAFVVAGGVAVVVAVVVAFGVAGVVATISKLSSLPFLLVAGVLVFSLSYGQWRWGGLVAAAVLTALGAEHLGWSVLGVWPILLSIYYRLIPDFLVFAMGLSSLRLPSWIRGTLNQRHLASWLKRLPPFSSELVWLPVPGHAELLAQVGVQNPEVAVLTFQKMQASPLPGLTRTAKQALPDFVAGRLSQLDRVDQFQSLLSKADDGMPDSTLEVLLPIYFEARADRATSAPNLQADLAIVFPLLQSLAQGIVAALQNSNAALRERGLERVHDQLALLPSQLPSLGLSAKDMRRWQPVINRWQNLLALELEEQQRQSQGELLNPFQYGNPLKRDQADLFKGRQTFANEMVRLLLNRSRPTLVLHGPRRCGKTSFLNNLPRLLPNNWVPIFVDMQSGAATADEVGFLRHLARAIRRDGRSQGISVLTEPSAESFKARPYDVFETWLEQVLEQIGDRYLLLNLDEFEKIGTAIQEGKLSLTLFDELRSLIQHWERLGFVFSGVQTLEELGPNWSSYFISVVPIEMLYLEPNEAQDLLTNPDPEFELEYESGLIDKILQFTCCHPNLVQLIGAALVDEANERQTRIATAEMLEAAIPRSFTLGTSYFTNVWLEFTGRLNHPEEIQAGQSILKRLADGLQPSNPLSPVAQVALQRMVRYHVLRLEDGSYRFDIPMVQRWVKERAIFTE